MNTIVTQHNLRPAPTAAVAAARYHDRSSTLLAACIDAILARSWKAHMTAPQCCRRIHNAFPAADTPRVVANHRGQPCLHIRSSVVKSYFAIELGELSIIQWVIQRETSEMNPDQTVQLINLLFQERTESGLSVAEVARRAKLPKSVVWKIEQGEIAAPQPESLIAIGGVLGIPSIDLFTIVGWLRGDELPTLDVYLHTKYPELPGEAIRTIESQVAAAAMKYVSFNELDGGTTDDG